MPIPESLLRQRLEAPKKAHKNALERAKRHEARLRFHGQPTLSEYEAGWAATEFLQSVKERLPADKYANFINLFRFPVQTVSLMEKVYTALEKVFDGRDPVFHYEFTDGEWKDDWQYYQSTELKPGFWRNEAFEAMKTAINSVLVVDLPREQAGELPEPYYYLLDIGSVLEYEAEERGKLEWIAFTQDIEGQEEKKQIAVIDDTSYRLFSTEDGAQIDRLEYEAPHGLGYCPARWFWTTPITSREPELKKAPATVQLDNLDWLLYYAVSKRNLDNYGSWAIYWGFSQDCDYRDEHSGHYCDGGFLRTSENIYIINRQSGTVRECPVCSTRRLSGAGSFIEVPPPGPHNDGADLRPPVGIVTVDRASLDYAVSEENRLSTAIFRNITGDGGEPVNDQAVNEKQVGSFFEAKKEKIQSIAKNFDMARQWAEETVCRLRYGPAFVSASVSYGTDWYLFTADELHETYQDARKGGAGSIALDMLQDQFFETKYRNNPEALRRVGILKNLEPLRHLDNSQAQALFQAGAISLPELILKINFSSLILRFERENMAVTEFGAALEFGKKVEAIRETLLQYATQQTTGGAGTSPPQPPGEGSAAQSG